MDNTACKPSVPDDIHHHHRDIHNAAEFRQNLVVMAYTRNDLIQQILPFVLQMSELSDRWWKD